MLYSMLLTMETPVSQTIQIMFSYLMYVVKKPSYHSKQFLKNLSS